MPHRVLRFFPFAAVVALIAAPSAADAQDARVRVSERLRHKDRLAAVSLPVHTVAAEFTVAPVAMRAVRARPARAPGQGAADVEAPPAPPVPPDPVEPETLDILGEALGGGFGGAARGGFQSPGPPVLDHIELSARVPWVNEKGYLHAVLAYTSSPASPSINFNKNFPGALTVNLKVEEGRTYLVDFAVSSWGSGTYRVETAGGVQEFADNQGNLEHVLVALSATESGWIDVRLRRTGGTGHYVFSVTVDRME